MGQVARLYNRSKDYLFLPPFDGYWRRRLNGRVICLLYHRVDEPENNRFLTSGGSPVISPHELEADLRLLKSLGARFLTFGDLRQDIFPDNSEFGVIISFDDCFKDNYTNGLDVLESLGIKGVFFQATGMIGAYRLIWEHALYWLIRNAETAAAFTQLAHQTLGGIPGLTQRAGAHLVEFMREELSPELIEKLLARAKETPGLEDELREAAQTIYAQPSQVKRAHDLGHEIGSHGHQHLKRRNIDDDTFESELARSVAVLTEINGVPPKAFSYPFNSYLSSDHKMCSKYFAQAATVNKDLIFRDSQQMWLPRFTWPGKTKNSKRQRRWLLTGKI